MIYKGIKIDNTFAEAFNMKASRIIVTADNSKWARNACDSFTGFATSVIACGIEWDRNGAQNLKHQMEDLDILYFSFQCLDLSLGNN